MRVFVPGGVVGALGAPGDADTGITQVQKGFENDSLGEPTFGSPSRVQVVPMAPLSAWNNVTHDEPIFDPTTGTVHVLFSNSGAPTTINVLFWDPHSLIGPGQADTYNDESPPPHDVGV
jgi:hypothetical protein